MSKNTEVQRARSGKPGAAVGTVEKGSTVLHDVTWQCAHCGCFFFAVLLERGPECRTDSRRKFCPCCGRGFMSDLRSEETADGPDK